MDTDTFPISDPGHTPSTSGDRKIVVALIREVSEALGDLCSALRRLGNYFAEHADWKGAARVVMMAEAVTATINEQVDKLLWLTAAVFAERVPR